MGPSPRDKQIDKLYIARKNVYSVLNQIKFMEELPDRIKVMTARITSDYTFGFLSPVTPSSLKVVYDEWLEYYAWMWKIKDQIATISDPSRKTLTEEIYQDCFASIQSLQAVLEEKLWEHIYRCIEIAQIDPAALVRALTIIEKNQRRKDKAKRMAERGLTVVSWILNDRDWVDECKDRLLSAIQRRCERAYSVVLSSVAKCSKPRR